MNKILFITNGHGEAAVAEEIIKHLPANYVCAKLSLANETLPGGGFSLRNLRFLLQDVAAGLVGNTFKNYQALKNLRGQIALTVAIGDIVPLLGALVVKAPFVFVGVNKSSYYKTFGYNYTPWEKVLLKKFAKKVFVRDQVTADNLKNWGIKVPQAGYVGNPLMDCISSPPSSPSPSPMERGGTAFAQAGVRIGFLPGTREDASLNLEDFRKAIDEIESKDRSGQRFEFITATKLTNIPIKMTNKPFAEVIAQADLIIGLSGTGNEQAAGMGKPVIAFYGRGAQYNKKFAQAQKELLGQALLLVPGNNPKLAACWALDLLRDPVKMAEMGRVGKERIGAAGAVEKIANYLINSPAISAEKDHHS